MKRERHEYYATGPDKDGYWLVGYALASGFKTEHRVKHWDVAAELVDYLQNMEDEGNLK